MDTTEEEKKSILIKYFHSIKSNFAFILVSIIALSLIVDYFIFTDVLHLNQAYFFNDLLSVVAQEQPLILIFVMLPILLFILISGFLYKFQFDISNYFFNETYRRSYTWFRSFHFLARFIIGTIFVLIIIYGDLLIFKVIVYINEIFHSTPFEMTFSSFLLTLSFLYIIYNAVTISLIVLLSSYFIIKYKTFMVSSFLLGCFISMKLVAYFLMQFIPYLKELDLYGFELLILLNFALITPSFVYIIGKHEFNIQKERKTSKEKFSKPKHHMAMVGWLLFSIISLNLGILQLHNIYKAPYNTQEFWDDIPKNSLVRFNFAILINSLKVVAVNEDKNKFEVDLDLIKTKAKTKFGEEIEVNTFTKEPRYFYIPYSDYRIVFIQDNVNNLMLTTYGKFSENKQISIIDVGYIEIEEKKKVEKIK